MSAAEPAAHGSSVRMHTLRHLVSFERRPRHSHANISPPGVNPASNLMHSMQRFLSFERRPRSANAKAMVPLAKETAQIAPPPSPMSPYWSKVVTMELEVELNRARHNLCQSPTASDSVKDVKELKQENAVKVLEQEHVMKELQQQNDSLRKQVEKLQMALSASSRVESEALAPTAIQSLAGLTHKNALSGSSSGSSSRRMWSPESTTRRRVLFSSPSQAHDNLNFNVVVNSPAKTVEQESVISSTYAAGIDDAMVDEQRPERLHGLWTSFILMPWICLAFLLLAPGRAILSCAPLRLADGSCLRVPTSIIYTSDIYVCLE